MISFATMSFGSGRELNLTIRLWSNSKMYSSNTNQGSLYAQRHGKIDHGVLSFQR